MPLATGFGYRPDNITVLGSEQALRDGLDQALGKFIADNRTEHVHETVIMRRLVDLFVESLCRTSGKVDADDLLLKGAISRVLEAANL